MIGRVFGGYRLEELLGQGSFGVVYRARHIDLGWIRAVKLARAPHYGDLIREEGILLAKLRHPNVVELQHMETSGEFPFLVVEYVDGRDLQEELRQGAMTPARVLEMARQLLDGLGAAHSLGLVHRDIKPRNVLLARESTAKLSDFGLGKIVHEQSLLYSRGESLTSMAHSRLPGVDADSQWHIVGTLPYLAPEQRRGAKPDRRSDLYSLGVVLYEALTLQLPEWGSPLPGAVLPDVPRCLDALLEALLARTPQDRPRTAAAAATLLEAGPVRLAGPAPAAAALSAAAPTSPDSTRRGPAQRPRSRAPQFALVAAFLVAVILPFMLRQWLADPPPSHSSDDRPALPGSPAVPPVALPVAPAAEPIGVSDIPARVTPETRRLEGVGRVPDSPPAAAAAVPERRWRCPQCGSVFDDPPSAVVAGVKRRIRFCDGKVAAKPRHDAVRLVLSE